MSTAIQAWINGFKPWLRTKAEEIELPEELICGTCLMVFPLQHFTRAQLHAAREAVYKEGPDILLAKHVVKCQSCSGISNMERKCRICRKWKSIDFYARVQRNLDSPICMRCQDWNQQGQDRERHLALKDHPVLENKDGSVISGSTRPEDQGIVLAVEAAPSQPGMENEVVRPKPSPASNVRKDGWTTEAFDDVGSSPVPESAPEEEDEEVGHLETGDYL